MGGRKRVTWALIVMLLLVFSSLTAGVSAAIVGEVPTVRNLGKGLYYNVAEAVEGAEDGDVILVGPGVYDEPVIINKELTIIGTDEATEITATWFVWNTSDTITGKDFESIISADWNLAAGITTMHYPYYLSTSNPISGVTIKNCNFKNVKHGIYLFGARNCIIEDCTFSDSTRGVSIQNHVNGNVPWRVSSFNTIRNCNFYNMTPLNDNDGEAVAIHDTDYNTIENCYVDGVEWGFMIYKGDYNTIKGCEIVNVTQDPLWLGSISTRVTVQDNIIRDFGGNISILECNNIIFSNNEINGSSILLRGSTRGIFTDNNITTSDDLAFNFEASDKDDYAHTIATSNTLGGNPIHYYYDQVNPSVSNTTAATVMFAYCSNPNVTDTEVVNGDGIRLVNSPNSNITANVTNTLRGIELVNSGGGRLDGCDVDTSVRGLYGIRLLDSEGQNTSDCRIATPNGVPAWQMEGGGVYHCYNTTFPYRSVSGKINGGGELVVHSSLTIRVMENETLGPLEGVEALLEEDSSPFYSTPHFGGSHNTTDTGGVIGPISLIDRVYKNHFVPIENDHDLDLWFGVDDIWTKAIHNINMSKDLLLVLETVDVWKPAMPANFTVTDIPSEDALEATWDLNSDDTEAYSFWSNISGSWTLVDNLTATADSYRIDQGLVHGGSYYFTVSAWDEVPLESNRTEALMVDHVDGLAPAAPTGLSGPEVNGTDLSLLWDANTETDLEGYRVYINETGGDENGPWVLLTPLSGWTATALWVKDLASETVYNFVVTAIDERPNESPQGQVVTLETDDITPPDAPIMESLPVYMNFSSQAVTGTAEPGSTVTLLQNGLVVDNVVAENDGSFSITVTLVKGVNAFKALATDPSGNVGPESSEVRTTFDPDAPDAPILDPLPGITNIPDHTLAGSAEPMSMVTIILNGEAIGTIEADAGGDFELQLTLVEGENTLTAYATDAALNAGDRATVQTVVLDTIAPDVPTVGSLPGYTNADTHTVAGTAEPGSLVEILAGYDVIAELTASVDGSYSHEILLIDRMTVIKVRATDEAQNVGVSSQAQTMILDTEAPDPVAGEDIEVVEGTQVLFDGSVSSDNEGIAAFTWTFDLDGNEVQLDGATPTHTFPDVVTLTVTLTVTDLAGNSAEDTLQLTISSSNLPPTLRRDNISPGKGNTGTKFEFSVEFKDTEGDTGQVWIVIDGESYPMVADPDDTDTMDGQRFTYETKMSKGDHTYYFTGKDSFGNDAVGSSAGEDNTKSSPDVSEKKVSDTPGPAAILVAMAMLTLVALHRVRRRMGSGP